MPSYSDLSIISQIGSGSFADVFLAKDNNGHSYAIKSAKQLSSNESIRSMRKELAIMKYLPYHRNVIKLFDAVETASNLHIVLERCHQDLYDYLMDNHPHGIPLKDAILIFIKILHGIAHCHKHKVYHRDIKPENILVIRRSNSSHDVDIKISDFGLATRENMSNEYGCGSIRYMSPEGCNDNANTTNAPLYSSEKADVWALGIVLINLLTGRNPWEKPSKSDPHYVRFLNNRSKSFFHRIFGLPQAIDLILESIFQANPAARPSVQQLIGHFEAILTKLAQAQSQKTEEQSYQRHANNKVSNHRQQAIMVSS